VDDIHASVVVALKVRGILSANAGSRNGGSFFLFPQDPRTIPDSRITLSVPGKAFRGRVLARFGYRKERAFEWRIQPFGSADFHRINALYSKSTKRARRLSSAVYNNCGIW